MPDVMRQQIDHSQEENSEDGQCLPHLWFLKCVEVCMDATHTRSLEDLFKTCNSLALPCFFSYFITFSVSEKKGALIFFFFLRGHLTRKIFYMYRLNVFLKVKRFRG